MNESQTKQTITEDEEMNQIKYNEEEDQLPELDKLIGKSKKKSNSSQAIKTFCRIRPVEGKNEIFKVKENTEGKVLLVNCDPVLLKKLNAVPTFTFSKTFDETSTQLEVFENTCRTLVEDLMSKKKSGLIFTYGMTNAGKTYTVTGSPTDPGILPRSLQYLYEQMVSDEANAEMSIMCNFVEIYNEEAYDLLSIHPKNKYFKNKLTIRENTNKKYFMPEVTYLKISSLEDFNMALQRGISKKVHAATNLNQNSSRSHTIFKIILKWSNIQDEEEVSLSIVDLAGSERANRTEALGKELQEACSINQSLSILGKCMESLRHNSIFTKKIIVPFRESKLTKLFQEYFQGDQNVIMITNINPRRDDFEETMRALNYSCIAKEIKPVKSKIIVNPIKKIVKLVEETNQTYQSNVPTNFMNENIIIQDSKVNSNEEINFLKSELEKLKEEMMSLKHKETIIEQQEIPNQNYQRHSHNRNNNTSISKLYQNHNENNYTMMAEMQLAIVTQMNQMMKMMKTMSENNPMSMLIPGYSSILPIQNNLNNINNNDSENANLPRIDMEVLPPNTNSLNLVFINSKFNDFHMGQKKKRPTVNRNNRKKNSDLPDLSDILTVVPLEENLEMEVNVEDREEVTIEEKEFNNNIEEEKEIQIEEIEKNIRENVIITEKKKKKKKKKKSEDNNENSIEKSHQTNQDQEDSTTVEKKKKKKKKDIKTNLERDNSTTVKKKKKKNKKPKPIITEITADSTLIAEEYSTQDKPFSHDIDLLRPEDLSDHKMEVVSELIKYNMSPLTVNAYDTNEI